MYRITGDKIMNHEHKVKPLCGFESLIDIYENTKQKYSPEDPGRKLRNDILYSANWNHTKSGD